MAKGGEQWNCLFDFSATVGGAPAEFRVRVGDARALAGPARSDRADHIRRVRQLERQHRPDPVVPAAAPAADDHAVVLGRRHDVAAHTTALGPPVSGWNAIGQYWSRGVDDAVRRRAAGDRDRPAVPAGRRGSEYITEVVDSDDPTVALRQWRGDPAGTQLTAVAIARLCG